MTELYPTITSVVQDQLCTGCGICENVCHLKAIELSVEQGLLRPHIDNTLCTRCGLCFQVCPGHAIGTERLSQHLYPEASSDADIGRVVQIYSGYAIDYQTRWRAASGGMVTCLLKRLLRTGQINGALVVCFDPDKPMRPRAIIARTEAEIEQSRSSKYCPVALGGVLRQVLHTPGRYAVVGLPCHLHGIRKMEQKFPELRQRLIWHFGIFCSGTRSFPATEFYLAELGVKAAEVKQFAYRDEGCLGSMTVTLDDNRKFCWPYADYYPLGRSFFLPARCALCHDQCAELADLAFGDLHIPEFWNDHIGCGSVIARSPLSRQLLIDAEMAGAIALSPLHESLLKKAQSRMLRRKKRDVPVRIVLYRGIGCKVPDYDAAFAPSTISDWIRTLRATSVIGLSHFIGAHRKWWWLIRLVGGAVRRKDSHVRASSVRQGPESMQVAIVNNYLYMRGGSERVMFDEARWVEGTGGKVAYFGQSNAANGEFPHADLFPEATDYEALSGPGKLIGALHVIRNRRTGGRFAEFLGRVRPDVVHCHNIYGGLTTAIIEECRSAGVPSVLTLHDYKLACPSYLMLNHGEICHRCVGGRFYHCVRTGCHKNSRSVSLISTLEAYYNEIFGKYRKTDYLITPSRFMMKRMLEHGLPAKKLLCIPNGFDPTQYTSTTDDRGYLLYLGRLSREKGIHNLIKAVADTSVPTRIAGAGPEYDQLTEFASVHGGENITFDGYRTGPDLVKLMQGAMFIVVPSEWYENASMTVLEAMAYGKPVIASRIGGIPEQVVDGETGLLFEPGNVTELRHAIQRLAADKSLRIAMGKAGRERLEARFSLDRHCTSLQKVYRAAIRNEPITQTDLDDQE